MTLLPELALGFLALFAAYLLGARSERRKARERRAADVASRTRKLVADREARLDASWQRLLSDLRDEGRAEREALAELCAILGPREVPE